MTQVGSFIGQRLGGRCFYKTRATHRAVSTQHTSVLVGEDIMALSAENRELPRGWEAGNAADGRTYYVNHVTGTTTWEVSDIPPQRLAVELLCWR